MSNHVYPAAKDRFLRGQTNWLTDPVAAVLVNTQFYTYSDAHATLLDLTLAARVAVTTGTLTGRTVAGGVVDANDASFGSVTGNIASAIIVCTDTGTDASSYLICYLDSGTGLPVNPDGGIIDIQWSNGANKIFAI